MKQINRFTLEYTFYEKSFFDILDVHLCRYLNFNQEIFYGNFNRILDYENH